MRYTKISNIELAEVSANTEGQFGHFLSLQVLVQAGAPINQKADGTFFHPKYGEGYPIILNKIQHKHKKYLMHNFTQGPADKQTCKEHKLWGDLKDRRL